MITEDYVNKEIALLLREKGFDEPTLYHYNRDNKEPSHTIDYDLIKNSETKEFCSAPTLQMAMKWLRKVHKVDIDIVSRLSLNADDDHNYSYEIKHQYEKYHYNTYADGEFLTYEKACEAAIKYILENLI